MSGIWTADKLRALGVRTDLVTAADVLGIGRTAGYELARAGRFPAPVLRLGNRYVVPTAGLLKVLDVDPEPQPAASGSVSSPLAASP